VTKVIFHDHGGQKPREVGRKNGMSIMERPISNMNSGIACGLRRGLRLAATLPCYVSDEWIAS